MTEYDYSPEAYEHYLPIHTRIANSAQRVLQEVQSRGAGSPSSSRAHYLSHLRGPSQPPSRPRSRSRSHAGRPPPTSVHNVPTTTHSGNQGVLPALRKMPSRDSLPETHSEVLTVLRSTASRLRPRRIPALYHCHVVRAWEAPGGEEEEVWYRGLPFLSLTVGARYEIIQDAGWHHNMPGDNVLFDGYDRLLVAREPSLDRRGHADEVGWVLARHVEREYEHEGTDEDVPKDEEGIETIRT
ncbi:hypothetical protein FA95DRAFT_229274 [Auriscalpium vulgare]|uniref:Uncharacterized protein n=1 Tax=Auriscalpium vulgare TaxID=40419 RepID=A0ACB8RL50_9AGAM|nr:hypothetical protein FA95DRAFT_229274 [Auriscalpium vulgare]